MPPAVLGPKIGSRANIQGDRMTILLLASVGRKQPRTQRSQAGACPPSIIGTVRLDHFPLPSLCLLAIWERTGSFRSAASPALVHGALTTWRATSRSGQQLKRRRATAGFSAAHGTIPSTCSSTLTRSRHGYAPPTLVSERSNISIPSQCRRKSLLPYLRRVAISA